MFYRMDVIFIYNVIDSAEMLLEGLYILFNFSFENDGWPNTIAVDFKK